MTEKFRVRGIGRRNLLHAFLALPFLLALRSGPPIQTGTEGSPDDIVEIDGWILRRSDLS
jgi:hypothetical protein